MRTVAIVQARMGSTRLPGKVLADLCGRPLLEHVLERAAAADKVDEVVLATSDLPADDRLEAVANRLEMRCHRGSECDVLTRFRDAARAARADAIVRITGDCPLIDPDLIDLVIAALLGAAGGSSCDLASNALRRTYPKGLDAEALFTDVLERIARLGESEEAREHVTWYAYRERPDLFLLQSVEHTRDEYRGRNWSVDTKEDLERIRSLYERHGLANYRLPWSDLLATG